MGRIFKRLEWTGRRRKLMFSEEEIKLQICDIGKRMYGRNMVAANDGNISVKINDNEIICTPTGVSKGFMTPDMMCKLDLKGNVLECKEGYKPSTELKMHLRVYEKRMDIKAVLHAHPIYATSYAVMGVPLTKHITAESVISLGAVPLAKYATPSTKEVPDSIEEYLSDHNAVLLEKHGALSWALDLESAYFKMESLEFYAELLFKTSQLGNPKELDGEALEKLYEIKKQMK
jgi:L-fuculose-phosphate aldolase